MQLEIEEILSKYKQEELKIHTSLQETNDKSKYEIESSHLRNDDRNVTSEEAIARNKELLQEFETTKGNLRSKAIFSPMEMQWEQICNKYKEEPSLPVVKWRCHLPVFV